MQEYCNRARRWGLIPFTSIRDDGVSRQGGEGYTFENPEQYYRTYGEIPNYYERSWHADQLAYVAVLCEAAGMVPLLERAVRRYRVPVASSSGFDSLTVKHDLFSGALERYEETGQHTILLHLGDHDPSGWWMHRSMNEDLQAFCRDHSDAPEDLIDLRRVALTPRQISELRIEPDTKQPTAASKDSHAKEFVARGLLPAAQLEAIPPDTLTAIVRQGVESALDLDALAASQECERQQYAEVQTKLDEVNALLREAFGLDRGSGHRHGEGGRD